MSRPRVSVLLQNAPAGPPKRAVRKSRCSVAYKHPVQKLGDDVAAIHHEFEVDVERLAMDMAVGREAQSSALKKRLEAKRVARLKEIQKTAADEAEAKAALEAEEKRALAQEDKAFITDALYNTADIQASITNDVNDIRVQYDKESERIAKELEVIFLVLYDTFHPRVLQDTPQPYRTLAATFRLINRNLNSYPNMSSPTITG